MATAIVISIVGLFISSRINGVIGWINIGEVSFNVFNITPLLFIISLAGIFGDYNWNNTKNLLQGFLLAFMLCIFLIFAPSLPNTIGYGIAVTTIMIISGVKLRDLIILMSTVGVTFIEYMLSATYRIERLTAMINPLKHQGGDAWINELLASLRNSAGAFGQGAGLTLETLPSNKTDFIFTYIIYSFGWVTAIILISLVLAFIITSVHKWRNTPYIVKA